MKRATRYFVTRSRRRQLLEIANHQNNLRAISSQQKFYDNIAREMPHSIKEELPSSPVIDTNLSDADEIEANIEEQDADQEMTMVEAGVEGAVVQDVKQEVKLEELFADIESDEEFPSLTLRNVKVSSSPEAPASPMYVLHASGRKRNLLKILQKHYTISQVLRSRGHAILLSTIVSMAIPLSVVEPLSVALYRFRPSRICLYPPERCLSSIPGFSNC